MLTDNVSIFLYNPFGHFPDLREDGLYSCLGRGNICPGFNAKEAKKVP